MTGLRDLAQQAVDHGISVVPARMDGTKRPAGEWKQYQLRHAAGAELDAWFTPEQEAIGVICGRVSGGLEMLEFEGRAVARGLGSKWRDSLIEAGHADLYRRVTDGYTERTPSGGIHILYRSDTIEGNKKLAHSTDGVLIETRGEGGFVVISPTTGNCHPTGNPWKIIKGGFASIATISEQERAILHQHARLLDETPLRAVPDPVYGPQTGGDDERPGDRYNNSPDALKATYDLLIRHGWQHHHQGRDGEYYLTRPGKPTRDGWSATLAHPKTGGQGFYVFTTSDQFEAEHSYTPFQVLTILEHGGDYSAAARALVAEDPTWDVVIGGQPIAPSPAVPDDNGLTPLDLNEVVSGIFAGEEWLARPFLPKGRQVSLYATGKTGKSLLALEVACALAAGRAVMQEPAGPPQHVVYIDFEMTPADLQDRLADLDYYPKQDDWPTLLEHLHYYMLQPFDPFDTRSGGDQLVEVMERHDAQLVVIDTLIRSLEGEENSADTIKNFNRYTGQRVKAAARTLLRVDHAGKDAARGQRGTSAKRDDVDLIWRLREDTKVGDTTVMTLIKDASRMSWVPEQVAIKRKQSPLRHEVPALELNDEQARAYLWLNERKIDRQMALNPMWEDLVRDHPERPDDIGRSAFREAQKYRQRETK